MCCASETSVTDNDNDTNFKYCSGFEIMLFTCVMLLFFLAFLTQIENLQEQLRDKDKQLGNLKDRVKSLQTDSSNTDTALATLEEALSEKVDCRPVRYKQRACNSLNCHALL